MKYRNIKIEGDELLVEYHHYFGKIVPEFIIENGIPKHIVCLNPMYILEGLRIRTVNKKVMDVHIFGIHPNCDLNSGELCLKNDEKGAHISNIHAFKNIIVNRLKVYYYNDCHFRLQDRDCQTEPVNGFTKIDVNFNKGEIHECNPPFRRLYPRED
jgi:hypothetical protein